MVACSDKKQSITPEWLPLVESVYASATIKSAEQYSVFAPASGILKELYVREGDSVSANQILGLLDNANLALQAENSRLAAELARKNIGNLDEIRAQLNTAKRQLSLDSLNYFRQKELWSNDIGTKAQLEKARLVYDASLNSVKALQIRLNQTREQLLTNLRQAENQQAITGKSSRDFEIRSNISGRVYSINYEAGELVTTQKALAVVGRRGQFVIELAVDEVDISRIQPGMKTILVLESYPGKTFEARLTRILPSLDPKTQTFTAEAEFVQAMPALFPGQTAEASIVIQQKSKALVIPLNYLKTDSTVLAESGEIKVKTGLRSLDKVEIISGINEKTALIKP